MTVVHPSADLLIIGGGVSGLAAAIAALKAAPELSLLILEKEEKAARKLPATGNGRCNISHRPLLSENFFTADRGSFERLLAALGKDRDMQLFRKLGLLLRKDEAGRYYPYAEEASAVHKALTEAAAKSGARLLLSSPVAWLSKDQKEDLFLCRLENGEEFSAAKVIFAPGSPAAPRLGGSFSGERLLEDLGLACLPFLPALSPLILEEMPFCRQASGARFKGRGRLLGQDGSLVAESEGEFLITDYGISGIAAMDLAVCLSDLGLYEGRDDEYFLPQSLQLELDFFPDLDARELARFFAEKWQRLSSERLSTEDLSSESFYPEGLSSDEESCRDSVSTQTHAEALLSGLLHSRIIAGLKAISALEDFDRQPEKKARSLAWKLKGFTLTLKGCMGFERAQVARGGLSLKEIRDDFSCKKIPGLYVCGETLDVCGQSGGYNLAFAFMSGSKAGEAAARSFHASASQAAPSLK